MCPDISTQVSHSAANGHAIDSPALQPRIVVKKANGTKPKARILQQFAQDKLPTPASAVDERCRASDVGALLEIVQDTIRTPYAHRQSAEQERIEQEKSKRIYRCQAHEGDHIRHDDSREYDYSDTDKIANFRCSPYAAVQPENV